MALDALDPFNVRRQLERLSGLRDAAALATDPGFLMNARRALLPLPVLDRRQPVDTDVLPPFESRPIAALRDRSVGVVGGGGGGACVALVGVARALEEAGVEPEAIAACSGSAIWAAMWAGGMTAGEMAEFSLSWRPEDYLKVQWTGLPRFALSALRGFTGLGSGEALERLFDRRLWRMSAGETAVPLHTLAYDMDRGELEPMGTTHTPDLTLGELARIAVARPLVSDAVRVDGDLLVDGAVVDGFPADLLDDRLDHVVGLNVMLPAGLEGEDISGWEHRRTGAADAGRQLQMANQLELARRTRRRLGDRLILVEPVPYEGLHGMSFYDLFLDRRDWPALIRSGYRATVEALKPLRRRRRSQGARA